MADNKDDTLDRASGKLRTHALSQGGALLMAIGLWAAFDSWLIVSGLPIANGLAAIAAIPAGIVMGQIVHEWGHFSGALIGKSKFSLKPSPSILFFDFNYLDSSARQYMLLAAGGLLGSILLLVAVWVYLPIDNTARLFLLATAIGQLAFVLYVELPVSLGILKGGKPLDVISQHFGQGPDLFRRGTVLGITIGLISLWIFS